ncbi:histone-like nucleoid-structuring protein Lsr2 [Kutzneria sp. NPDC052558]|uniref:Lsr2 family DNA-binding protein n=1 Tax=Kutzneria sp. NPDC052558 TaxID=3364121 RepID=UPI0037C5EE9F
MVGAAYEAAAPGIRPRSSSKSRHGRRVGGRKQRGAGVTQTAVKAGGDKAQKQAIREWARSNGKPISDRGRIPADLIVEFQAAHA